MNRAKDTGRLDRNAKAREPRFGVDTIMDQTPLEEGDTRRTWEFPESRKGEEATGVVKERISGRN